jgi:hypothetical protein
MNDEEEINITCPADKLGIIVDKLRSIRKHQFACNGYGEALVKIEEAIAWLQKLRGSEKETLEKKARAAKEESQ